MNIQAYIESGILEEYVLGTVSPQEKQEVECMSHIYPEIKEELLRTESALEEYALKHQTPPPASLKESLFAKMNFDSVKDIDDTQADELTIGKTEQVSDETPGILQPVNTEDPKVISNVFDRVETREVTPFWAKLAVAAAVLLAMFAGWSAIQMTEYKGSNEQLAGEMNEMKAEMAGLKQGFDYNHSLAGLYSDPSYKVVKMAGMPKSPESAVSAFWNQQTNEVYVDVQKLPAAPAGKQYQLWTIVDGNPVDVGMLDNQFSGKVLKMKETKPGAVAFAITLEKEGGVPSPTMEQMYVMGKVS
ncbi:anti-sigma factor [Dyadobacter pollutisoli]|jgi:anti-sigma-K factor RskA|uniref:Anti-sigma factor n=1 Tax=Dyadobacter pollutisoli TaxID=2910158 RepID=A0A9E8SPD0_9BACT|nr:anti-sigma factor [Dyadobacter pollutisoli]WAC11762.1 anti-sigma factor [Dyadobacter pollutisoli]